MYLPTVFIYAKKFRISNTFPIQFWALFSIKCNITCTLRDGSHRQRTLNLMRFTYNKHGRKKKGKRTRDEQGGYSY